jgi:hypothetical protein
VGGPWGCRWWRRSWSGPSPRAPTPPEPPTSWPTGKPPSPGSDVVAHPEAWGTHRLACLLHQPIYDVATPSLTDLSMARRLRVFLLSVGIHPCTYSRAGATCRARRCRGRPRRSRSWCRRRRPRCVRTRRWPRPPTPHDLVPDTKSTCADNDNPSTPHDLVPDSKSTRAYTRQPFHAI